MVETLYASFSEPEMAEKAVGALLDHGARGADISLVTTESYRAAHIPVRPTAVEPGFTTTSEMDYAAEMEEEEMEPSMATAGAGMRRHAMDPVEQAKHGISTTTPGDAAAGAGVGAGIGLGVGALAALASIFVPGVGIVYGGGTLAMALTAAAGTAAAGAVAGGVTGYLRDLGVPERAAPGYHRAIETGGAMIAIRVPTGSLDRAAAERILAKYHAGNVDTYHAPAI